VAASRTTPAKSAAAAFRTAAGGRRRRLRAERVCTAHPQLLGQHRRLPAHAGQLQSRLVLPVTALTRRRFAAGSLALAAASPAFAQTWPDRPIKILAGYPAGGGIDLVARLFAEQMKAAFNQIVIVENRPGASAMIASNAVAKAAPDGLTLLMAASGEVAINQHLYGSRMSYDPARELTPVALVGIVPCVVVVAVTTPVKDARELIAYVRANRGKLSFSSSGVGNPQQLAGELMNHMAGTDVLHVPYRGAAPAVADVATGAVTMSFTSLAAALPFLDSGKLRAVAVTSRERMPQLPDVPALAEVGPELKDYELLNWFGLFATGGTPEAAIGKLNAVVNDGLRDPKIAAFLQKQGIVPRPMSAAEYAAFVRAETEKFGAIVKQANIRAEN
jgi:tripartite-type tricarboxylate transporter receptor subunit TctC